MGRNIGCLYRTGRVDHFATYVPPRDVRLPITMPQLRRLDLGKFAPMQAPEYMSAPRLRDFSVTFRIYTLGSDDQCLDNFLKGSECCLQSLRIHHDPGFWDPYEPPVGQLYHIVTTQEQCSDLNVLVLKGLALARSIQTIRDRTRRDIGFLPNLGAMRLIGIPSLGDDDIDSLKNICPGLRIISVPQKDLETPALIMRS